MTPRRLFPLALTAFERYMWLSDLPDSPSTFLTELRLLGPLQEGPFREALDEARQRHPLLGCVVQPGKRRLPCWVPDPELAPWVDWRDDDSPLQLPGSEFIDLTRELGLRVWVRTFGERSRITFQFHHCCTDGIGAYRFMADVLACYGRRTAGGGPAPELAPVDPGLLRARGRRMYFGAAESGVASWMAVDAESRRRLRRLGFRYLARHFLRPVTPIAAPRRAIQPDPPFPGWRIRRFDADQSKQLRHGAIALGVTLNDLLAAALFQAVRRWNAEQRGRSGEKGRYRLLIPTDLRGRGDEAAPAANFVGWIFVTLPAALCDDGPRLARTIREQTARAKHAHSGAEFTRAVTGALAVPGLLPLIWRLRGACFPTTILTNMGDLSRRSTARFPRRKGRIVAGDVILDEVVSGAPFERNTRAAVAVNTTTRAVSVSVRGQPGRFDPEAAQRLLDLYEAALLEFMA